jgi:formylglycine-generating enzyme required for sulfatase activity
MTRTNEWNGSQNPELRLRKSRCTMSVRPVAVVGLSLLVAAVGIAAEDQPVQKYTETLATKEGAKVSFDMVLIPGGAFVMGSPADQPDRLDNEGPQRKVQLDPFYLCTTETTLELFMIYYQETHTEKRQVLDTQQQEKKAEPSKVDVDAITGPTPVYGDMTMGHPQTAPAIGISWRNAETFCRWLAKKTGKPYRLPTEAEWEYAARAGTTSPLGSADDAAKLGDFAWYEANADVGLVEVAKKKANAWGLYDMQGNVWEWVQDFYKPTAYAETSGQGTLLNPTGPATGTLHVARGGSYKSPVSELRCAARGFEQESWRWNDPQLPKSIWWLPQIDVIGFRIASSLGPAAAK